MSDVLVAIPWRDNGDIHRKRSLAYVADNMATITGQPVHLVDGPYMGFSLSSARNQAFRLADKLGKDYVVVCDADTIVEKVPLDAAIALARINKRVILPFNLYRALTPDATQLVLAGRRPWQAAEGGRLDWSVGGALVASRAVWGRLGGQDERFRGWGCEDTAFNIVAERMGLDHVRVEGTIHHLWHPVSWRHDDPAVLANGALLARYADPNTNIEDIITEEGHNGLAKAP